MGYMETTFPLRAAMRLTGLSAERLRAWESRYRAVDPVRTPGGSRRYRLRDLERLRLLRSLVDAGHRIGEVAGLDDAALRERAAQIAVHESGDDDAAFSAALFASLERLDAEGARRLLEARCAELGMLPFAREFVLPFLREVGLRWETGRLSVAAEHLASSLLATMLGAGLHAMSQPGNEGPIIVFATPSGERHEVGLFVAAMTAAHAGAKPIHVGADVPVDDLVAAVSRSGASVLALGFASLDSSAGERTVRALRERLPARVEIWLGGAGMPRCAPIRGVVRVENLDQLAAHVASNRLARDGEAA